MPPSYLHQHSHDESGFSQPLVHGNAVHFTPVPFHVPPAAVHSACVFIEQTVPTQHAAGWSHGLGAHVVLALLQTPPDAVHSDCVVTEHTLPTQQVPIVHGFGVHVVPTP